MKFGKCLAVLIGVSAPSFSFLLPALAEAVPPETLKPEVEDPSKQGLMGCGLDEESFEGKKRVRIKSVIPGFAAYHAGIQAGDIVLKLDEKALTSAQELTNSIKAKTPGDWAVLSILRNEKPLTIKVRVSSRADFANKGPKNYEGKQAPPLFVVDRKGLSSNLAERSGKLPVVVMLWATWCPACKQALPIFKELKAKFSGKIEFAIVTGEDFATFDAFRKEHPEFDKFGLTNFQSDETKLHIAYWAEALPTFVLIGKDSKLQGSVVGLDMRKIQDGLKKL